MPKHKLTIVQTFKAWREITVEVDAPTPDPLEAARMMEDGELDVPGFSDPRWTEKRDLQDESVRPA